MNETILKSEIELIAYSFVVNSPASYEEAGKTMIALNDLLSKIKNYWKPLKEKAYEAHKIITSKENEMINPVEERKKILSAKISSYLTEQSRIKMEEQRRLDVERLAQEKVEMERLEKESKEAENNWELKKAAELKNQSENVYIPPSIVQSEIKKIVTMDTGTMSVKKDIEVEIINVSDILRHIISGKLPTSIIEIKELKLKQFLKMSGIMELSGCNIREVINAQVRKAR